MALASNDVDWVQIDDFSASSSASEFAKNMAIHRGYTSLPEMSALNLNRGLAMPSVSELFVYSYDPDPNSIPTNYADIGNFNIVLTNKFNINSITNYQPAYYFQAIGQRLDKLLSDPMRDKQWMAEIQPHWRRYLSHANNHTSEELQRYRWMIEEFRISLFAQGIKTAFPISAKRLEKQWALCH